MRVLISGSHGLIGSALREALLADGATVGRLVRRKDQAAGGDVYWNYEAGEADLARMDGCDAVVHLAGESLAAGRWTPARKTAIRWSREDGTRHLAQCLAALERKPAVLVSASAVGFYGDTGSTALNEAAPAGRGFLAEVCESWEAAAAPARETGIRVVHPRLGVVLSRKGGALEKMLMPFRLGLGGPLGGGSQYMSWVHIDDVVAALRLLIARFDISGPVNVTTPHPVTNREFTKALAKALGRPAIIPVPGFALRLALGEMAGEALLASNRVVPARLQQADFAFRFSHLPDALRDILKPKA